MTVTTIRPLILDLLPATWAAVLTNAALYLETEIDGTILARLSTQQLDLGRAYTVTASGAKPTSPVSVMQRG